LGGGGAYIRRGEMSTSITHRVPEAIFFRGDLIMTTMTGMMDWHAGRRYLAELWIMKFEKIVCTAQARIQRMENNISGRD